MKYQKIIYIFLALFVVVAVSVFLYISKFVVTSSTTEIPSSPVATGSTQEEQKKTLPAENLKIMTPFFLKQSSEEYKTLTFEYASLASGMAVASGVESKGQAIEDLYAKLFNFYANEKNSARERAYALNLATLVYITGFDAKLLERGVSHNPDFAAQFKKHLAYVKTLKPVNAGPTGVMFESGTPTMNYAAQKTMAYINSVSYDLYPGSYALLRNNLNNLQGDYLLNNSFVTGKKYANVGAMMLGVYGPNYFADLDKKVQGLIAEKRLYEDTYASSYEINIMYASGVVWSKYQLVAGNPSKKQEAEKLLTEYVLYANRMVEASNEYNTGRLFYGYVLSAFTKSRASRENVFPEAKNAELVDEAQKTLLKLMRTVKSKQLSYWIKNLPKTGWMYGELEFLTQGNEELKQFVQAL